MSKDSTIQQFALARAKEIVTDNPDAAFDLVLAADKAAAKDPRLTTLNRSLRKVKTEAVKYLNRKLPGLVWEAGSTYDYIGIGSQFQLHGSVEVRGPSSGRISVEITAEGEDAYSVRVYATGKGNRQLDGEYIKGISLNDFKTKPGKWLDRSIASLKSNLEGSLEAEKQSLLDYADSGIEDLNKALKEAKDFKAKVQASKNLIADIDELRRAVPSVTDPFYGTRRLLDDLKKAGG